MKEEAGNSKKKMQRGEIARAAVISEKTEGEEGEEREEEENQRMLFTYFMHMNWEEDTAKKD